MQLIIGGGGWVRAGQGYLLFFLFYELDPINSMGCMASSVSFVSLGEEKDKRQIESFVVNSCC